MGKRAVKRRKKVGRGPRSLLVNTLENVSKKAFKECYEEITDLIGDSPGIYALYDGPELYYVGKSTDLRNRVKSHLHDRHYASWTHFSLYLVRRAEHISEIESLLVRIANPEGNRKVPKGRTDGQMRKKLKGLVKQKYRTMVEEMFGEKIKTKRIVTPGAKAAATHRKLKGLVQCNKTLYRTYKGKDYKATLTPSGTIRIGGKNFASPTAAAQAVTKKISGSGWDFWFIKNKDGVWVRLSDYAK
jgi:hypothetical protein